jgi:hypothetical protein
VKVEGRSSINPLEEIIALTSIIKKIMANSWEDSAFLKTLLKIYGEGWRKESNYNRWKLEEADLNRGGNQF